MISPTSSCTSTGRSSGLYGLLLTRPGFLTLEYFPGRCSRYISAIRLYLIFSLVYFAASVGASQVTFEADENIEVGAIGRMLGLETMSPDEANRFNRVIG